MKNSNTKTSNSTNSSLTAKQERFCREYIIDCNASAAAKRAGFSANSAGEQGHQLLQKTSIQEKIQQLKSEQAKRLELNADWVLKRLMRIADADIAKAFDKNGAILPVHEMPRSIRRAVAGIEQWSERNYVPKKACELDPEDSDYSEDPNKLVDVERSGITSKFKLENKTKALELLGKHLKLFTEKYELSGRVTLEELVVGSMDDESKKDT